MRVLKAEVLTDDISALEQRAEWKEEVFEDAVALGQDAVREGDLRRIVIGRLASCIERRYNEQNVKRFADEINCGVKAVRQYQNIVEFYGWQTCVELLDELSLSYSHLRAAMRLDDREQALALLEEAANAGWKVSVTEVKAGKGRGQWVPLVDLQRARLVSIDYRQGYVTFRIGDALDKVKDYVGQDLKLDVRVKKEEQHDTERKSEARV
jgi:hypothetical protein